MVKQPRKRQKTSKEEKVQPLGINTDIDDTGKDDEERRLESMLFGVPYVPSDQKEGKGGTNGAGLVEGTSKELESMMDSDLFFIDDSAGPSSNRASIPDETFIRSSEHNGEADISDEEAPFQREDGTFDNAVTDHDPETSSGDALRSTVRKAPAWVDPDDANVQVSLASNNRLRKLRDAPSEDSVGGREYERRLRRQYERINPTPQWASKARKKLHPKRRRSSLSGSEPEDNVEDAIPDLLASTGGISGGKRSNVLSPGIISIERLRDANQAAPAEGEIKSLQFHPGSSILLTGPRPFYYTYDLQSGASHRSPRGLWGTTFCSPNEDTSMETCAFSPSGDVLAVAGRRGHIHLVDWRSGAAQVVGGLKANAAIKSLWWSRAGEGSELLSLTEDSQVYVWDVGQRKCVKRWQDDGGFGSRIMGGDQRGSYLSIGSNTGLVNIYSRGQNCNLTTNISCLRYNHDSQLLAISSNVKKDQMRLIHLPSLTAFGNWPTTSTPLGHVTSMDFSNGSEYLVTGNSRGRVLLYHLRDYGQQ
ncbi:WD40-repeat-containing domain protein [Melanogaster broomeanus]|nr:WD40-repeat-containing domain protein [Melanogaster broomeanus]